MANTLTGAFLFEAIHKGTPTPADVNLFTADDIATYMQIDSVAISSATSKAVSAVNAAAPDSSSISQANSRAISAGGGASIADSKAVSGSAVTSVADSKAISVSGNASIADSKAVSVSNSVPILTVVANSQNVSTADSKAVSAAALAGVLTPGGGVRIVLGAGTSDIIAIGTSALAAYGTPSSFGSIAIGHFALKADTTGENNIALGHSALEFNLTGSNNVAVGDGTLRFSTGGSNTAVGAFALSNTSTGIGNVAIGPLALVANTTGTDSIAIGEETLWQAISDGSNVAIGSRVMYEAFTSIFNTAVGVEAMHGNLIEVQGTTSLNNATIISSWILGSGWTNGVTKLSKSADGTGTAASLNGLYDYGVGAQYTVTYTIANLTAGSVTVSFGGVSDAARSTNGTFTFTPTATSYPGGFVFTPTNTSRFDITVATCAGLSTISAQANSAYGVGSLYHISTGINNVGMGLGSGRQITTGSDNTIIGTEAGVQIGTSSKCTIVGRLAGYAAVNADRRVMLGYMAGRYETTANRLLVDAFDRTDEATQRTSAIISGLMDANPANQTLALNAAVTVTRGFALGAGVDAVLPGGGFGFTNGTSRFLAVAAGASPLTTINFGLAVLGSLAVTGAFGMNGKTPVANVAAPTVASDLATVITLSNDMRTRLINLGIYT